MVQGEVRALYVFCLCWVTAHCVGSDALYDPPGGRGFWARRSDLTTGASSFYRTAAMFAAESNNALLYTEIKNEVSKDTVDSIISAFENSIVPIENVWYTTPTDVDKNQKIIFLLLDIQDGYQPGGSYIAGYFDPINTYTDSAANAANSNYHSNHAEMLYLDTYPGLASAVQRGDLNSFFGTIAHEYQHLLQFSKYFRGEQNDTEPSWVDEGLAEISSDLTGFGPQTGRANNFRTALLDTTSLITEPSAFLLDNYATSYIYFRYLADVYGLGGISLVFKNNFIGVTGVNDALQGLDSSLLASCGSNAGLSQPYFGCSYRMMWASLIKGNPGDPLDNTVVHYNGTDTTILPTGSYTYVSKPANADYLQTLVGSLSGGAYAKVTSTVGTGALKSYAPKLYKINPGGNVTNLVACSNCGLTMVVGSNYHVVFNHDVNTATTHAGNITDQVVADLALQRAEISEDVALRRKLNRKEAIAVEERKLHGHFPLSQDMRERLASRLRQ